MGIFTIYTQIISTLNVIQGNSNVHNVSTQYLSKNVIFLHCHYSQPNAFSYLDKTQFKKVQQSSTKCSKVQQIAAKCVIKLNRVGRSPGRFTTRGSSQKNRFLWTSLMLLMLMVMIIMIILIIMTMIIIIMVITIKMSTIVIAYFSAVARTVIRSCSRLQTCGHCWWQNFTTVWRHWDFLNFLFEPYFWKVLNPPTPVLMGIVPQVLFEQMTLIKNGSQLSSAQYSARNNCPSSR